MSWKTTKYEYDGIKFMSQGEINLYKELKASGINFIYQPPKQEIIPAFTGAAGKKYAAMMYEPDFLINIKHADCLICGERTCGHGGEWYETNIFIEVKGQNDNIYIFRKGQKPQIKNQTELYSLRHKLFDKVFTKKGDIFLVIRDNPLKTKEYAGMFWDKDLQQMRKYKTQGKKELCEKVPRAIERIKMIIKEQNE